MLKIEHSVYGLCINYVQAVWLGATRTQCNVMTVYKSILLLQSWCVHGVVDKVDFREPLVQIGSKRFVYTTAGDKQSKAAAAGDRVGDRKCAL